VALQQHSRVCGSDLYANLPRSPERALVRIPGRGIARDAALEAATSWTKPVFAVTLEGDETANREEAMAGDREARIRARAHEIWEKEGRLPGEEIRHWEQASREIDAEEAESSPGTTAGAEKGSAEKDTTVGSKPGRKPPEGSGAPKRGRGKQPE
jgi:hypothetical protein